MTITKDFEDRRVFPSVIGQNATCYSFEDVSELLEHARALEAMLKKHEWAFDDWCPECRSAKHKEDCQLAKLLEGVDSDQ